MAVDWGEVRIGVAACDPDALLAYPLGTVRTGEADIAELAALAAGTRWWRSSSGYHVR